MIALIDADVVAVKAAAIAERDEASESDACELAAGMIAKWTVAAEADRLVCCISCKGPTFRHKLYPQYKAKRPPKPLHTAAIYDYIRAKYRYAQVPELEADDVMGILGTLWDRSVIVTVDKDLLGVPGWHFNPDADEERHYINHIRAYDHELYQWAVGDTTDNIPGIRGIGPKKAAPLVHAGEHAILKAYGCEHTAWLMRRLVHILRADDFKELDHAQFTAPDIKKIRAAWLRVLAN